MSRQIRLCIVGAGSSYTSELIDGILAHPVEELPVADIRMQDINAERGEIMAGLARRMVRHRGRDVTVAFSTKLEEMLEGVDFVIAQIRVGGMKARHLDETIPLKYGIIGQETTGPGGMFKALRTIPAMLDIARTAEKVAPDAFILNYTNPSGIVTEAVLKHTNARLIGLCSSIPGVRARIKSLLEDEYPDLKTYCVGLNHLGFIHRMVSEGKDVTRDAIETVIQRRHSSGDKADVAAANLMRLINAIPISYTHYYFFRSRRIEQARARDRTRAQQIIDIEREVFAQASDPNTVEKLEALKKRGGGGYSNITFSFMKAILNDTGAELACTVQNRGAVHGIDDDAGAEIVCRVDRNGPEPLPVGPIPLAFRGLVQAVKAYETLTVEAAVKRNRSLAIQALANHPLAGDLDIVEPLVDEMLAAHGLEFA